MTNWPPEHIIRESKRAKRLSLKISAAKGLEVIVPTGYKQKRIPKLLMANKEWIEKHLSTINNSKPTTIPDKIKLSAIGEVWDINDIKIRNPALDRKAMLHKWLQKKGRAHLIPRLDQLSQQTNLPYNKVSIRGQQTRWGSCSLQKNINLNYKLLFLTPELVDYVIIHELCHTKHLNHSVKFWQLVAQFFPNYRELRKELRKAKHI